MGKYLANGIVTHIQIINKHSFSSELLLEKLKHFININNYEVLVFNDEILLILKEEIFDENIHELIKEVDDITSCNNLLLYNIYGKNINNDDIKSQRFNKKNYPITIESRNEVFYVKGKKEEQEWFCEPYNNYWLLWKLDDSVLSDIEIYIGLIPLWQDANKYCGEDANKMLYIINTFKNNYYKSKLAKSFIFFILG